MFFFTFFHVNKPYQELIAHLYLKPSQQLTINWTPHIPHKLVTSFQKEEHQNILKCFLKCV